MKSGKRWAEQRALRKADHFAFTSFRKAKGFIEKTRQDAYVSLPAPYNTVLPETQASCFDM